MIAEKIRRAKNWKPYVPFDMAEHEANKDGSFINKFLFRVGTNDNYNKIRSRCKAEGVSVGSLGLASSFMAMACVNASTTGEKCCGGLKTFFNARTYETWSQKEKRQRNFDMNKGRGKLSFQNSMLVSMCCLFQMENGREWLTNTWTSRSISVQGRA